MLTADRGREQKIIDQIIHPFTQLGHSVLVAESIDGWHEILGHYSDRFLGNELRYGWTLPFECESPTGKGIAFFPRLIVEQTERDSDAKFSQYIDAIEYRLNHYFAWFGDTEKTDKIDSLLYDEAPGSFDVLNEVQLRVLIEGADASG